MKTGFFWAFNPYGKDSYELCKGYIDCIPIGSGIDSISVGYDKRSDGWRVTELSTGLSFSKQHKTKATACQSAKEKADSAFKALSLPHNVKDVENLRQWSNAHKEDITAAIEEEKANKAPRVPSSKYPGINFPAVKRVCRAVEKSQTNSNRPYMAGLFEQSGDYILCDGYRAFRFYQDIEEINHAPEPEKGYRMDICNFINSALEKNSGRFLNLPDIAELKEFIHAEKERQKAIKSVGIRPFLVDDYIYVNPQYLLDFMQVFPGCKAYKPESNIAPIYFLADGGDGILMPVRPPKTEEELAREKAKSEEYCAQVRKDKEEREEEINNSAEVQINSVIDVLLNGGEILTKDVEYIENGVEVKKNVILRIAELYNVSIPPKTKGWIQKSLGKIKVEDGRLSGYCVYKGHNKSTVIWGYIGSIINAIIVADDCNKSVESENDICESSDEKHEDTETQSKYPNYNKLKPIFKSENCFRSESNFDSNNPETINTS